MTDETETEALHATAVLESLPFVVQVGDDLTFWNIEPSGHRDTDIDTGERYGRLAIAAARQFENPMILALIMTDIVKAGNIGAMEAGFLHCVARAARAGSMN